MSAETTSLPADRHFIRRWFRVLDKRLLLSDRHALDAHNVRVEASGTSDWWIQVQPPVYERCHGCGFYSSHAAPSLEEQEAQLWELREALVLLTLYARIDYDSWLQELKATSGLRFRKNESLLSRFGFVVSAGSHKDGSFPCELLADVFTASGARFSKAFMESYELLKALAEREHASLEAAHPPLPVRLEFSQLNTSSKGGTDLLRSLSNAITTMRKHKPSVSQIPAFDLDCVELRLRRLELNSATLASISAIVDSGVRIKFLELPGRLEDPVDQEAIHLAWRALARKLFHSSRGSATSGDPQIERLELPPVYFSTDLAASWLPLLTTATNVRSLTIDADVEPGLPTAASIAWAYLTYALFSKDANNSVESVHFRGLRDIPLDVTESMAGVASSTTPQVRLWRALEQHPHAVRDGLRATYLKENVPSKALQSKLRRLVLSVSSKQAAEHDTAQLFAFITTILCLGGHSLTDLSIDGARINDATLQKCLELCPSLQNLRVSTADLGTLHAFTGSSARNLSSLDLRSIHTSKDAVHDFFKHLQTAQHLGGTSLERVRIGQGWSAALDGAAPRILIDALNANQTLSYLHVFRPNDMFLAAPSSAWDGLKGHDGAFIASRDQPLAMDRKLALLGSLKRAADEASLPRLNRDVLVHVFQFAAAPRRRTVVVETDQVSSFI